MTTSNRGGAYGRSSPRFRVHVGICLLAGNGVLGLSRWLRLPFVPYPGLDLFGLTTDPAHAETVEQVGWDVHSQCFHAELFERASPDATLAELIDDYGPDWELHEPGTKPVLDDP
jgi:hypothetical protein